MIDIPQPYLVFLGSAPDATWAKTGAGLRDWAGERCLAEFGLPDAGVTLGLPVLSPVEAAAAGAQSLVIGVTNRGGFIDDRWVPVLVEAMAAGLDIVSGLHTRLASVAALREAASRFRRRLIDVRVPPKDIPIATGRKRTGKRLLTVGTDCSLGKKYTALTIAREMTARGVEADFRATGQTGIMIAGSGIPIDAVVSDFVAGAAEMLSPDAAAEHWDVVEGQGAITHPSYAAVTLGLLHGSQADVLVLCHQAGRRRVMGLESFAIEELAETMALYLALAKRVNPAARFGDVSLNTAGLSDERANEALERANRETGLPTADPVRGGCPLAELVSACLS